MRFNERADADGKKVLFIEEIQSDWSAKGKKEGFKGPERLIDGHDYSWWKNRTDELFNTKGAKQQWLEAAANRDRLVGKPDEVPAAPFVAKHEFAVFKDGEEVTRTDKEGKKHRQRYGSLEAAEKAAEKMGGEARDMGYGEDTEAWVALALKRMIRYAAENGFERVTWTTGEQQAERYDLSKQVNEIRAFDRGDGTCNMMIRDVNNKQHDIDKTPKDKLADTWGKSWQKSPR